MRINLFATLILISLCFPASAQKTIAVLTGSNWTFYTDFSTALNQCAQGSTIYLPGGTFILSQSADTINKSVSIIGVGHYPDSTMATNRTVLSGDLYFAQGGDNVSLTGIEVTGLVSILFVPQRNIVSNLNINKCKTSTSGFRPYFNDSAYIQNIFISESVGDFNGSPKDLNITISNSIIQTFNFLYHTGTIFKNNILSSVGCSGCSFYPYSLNYCTFENNIIYSFVNASLAQNTFRNNLILNGDVTTCTSCVAISNNLTGTLSNTFIYSPTTAFNYTYDYHLLQSSVGRNAGTDGTDIGIYGSTYPYKAGAVPANPHISTKLISPSSAPNGTLPVNIRVIAQDR